jgi:hypothetical protein
MSASFDGGLLQALKEPSVVRELAYANGHWLFANFRYPEGSDLLTLLKQMKADRESQQN